MFAQDLPTAKPESVGLSSERLRADQRRRAARHQGQADRRRGNDGGEAWEGGVAEAAGMLDREAGKPMPADAMFRICSMTKPITSVAVMMLYEEGSFSSRIRFRSICRSSRIPRCW